MSAIDTSKPISKFVFENVEIPLASSSSGEDMLQARVDATNSCAYLYNRYSGTEIPYLNRLKTDLVTTMEYMFSNCSKLTALDVSSLNTENVTAMNNMFQGCGKLTELDVSNFKTDLATNMGYMFQGCSLLTALDVSNFNTENVIAMNGMFQECSALTDLDLSNFNTSNLTSMYQLVYKCSNLKTLDLSGWDTSNVTSFSYLCNGCSNLERITGTLDAINITSFSSLFKDCTNLITFTLKNIKKSLAIGSGTSYGTKLDDPTIINTGMELWDLTGSTSQTLTVATAVSAKLDTIYVKLIEATDEMIANDPYITNKKPCVVCESTDEGAMTLREYIVSKNWTISG